MIYLVIFIVLSIVCTVLLYFALVLGSGEDDRMAEQRYKLVWLENTDGELSERIDYFSCYEDMFNFVGRMLETGRLFEIVETERVS